LHSIEHNHRFGALPQVEQGGAFTRVLDDAYVARG
jgi:hypothetical protein